MPWDQWPGSKIFWHSSARDWSSGFSYNVCLSTIWGNVIFIWIIFCTLKSKVKEAESSDKTNDTEEEKSYKFFGIAYLFSNAQVELLED